MCCAASLCVCVLMCVICHPLHSRISKLPPDSTLPQLHRQTATEHDHESGIDWSSLFKIVTDLAACGMTIAFVAMRSEHSLGVRACGRGSAC